MAAAKEKYLLDMENWMTNLPMKLRSMPLIYLAIPGSHDSMTSSITSHSKLAPDAEEFLVRLKFLGPLLRLVMSRWSKTQAFDALQQLNAGVRYFDLRVAVKRGFVYPFYVHGLYATEVVKMLNQLKVFLDTHPTEVVVLDFQHFYAFDNNDHGNFMRLLTATFGDRLVPYTPRIQLITLEYMSRCRYQVIIVYRSNAARYGQPLLWPSSSFPTPWPQTVSKAELIEKLDEGIKNRSTNAGFVSQFVLTPTNWFVTKHLCSTLRKQCAKPIEKLKLEWLRRQKVGAGGINVVICDFVDMNDCEFVSEVIGLNAKLAELVDASGLTPVDK